MIIRICHNLAIHDLANNIDESNIGDLNEIVSCTRRKLRHAHDGVTVWLVNKSVHG